MAMKVLVARYAPPLDDRSKIGSFTVQAHLDTTKFLVDGTTPDPAYVLDRTYPIPIQQPNETKPQFRARVNAWWADTRPEFRKDAQYVLNRINDAFTLADEGTAL